MSTEELIVVEVSYANELHYSIQHYELRIYLAIRYSLLEFSNKGLTRYSAIVQDTCRPGVWLGWHIC